MRSLLAALLLAACARQPDAARLDAEHYLGESIHVGALTVWPVFSDTEPELEEFLTLREAQARGVANVREVGEGQVGSLVVSSTADEPIFICAGTVVHGGKQDRQIGQDFVIGAGNEVVVDAFCVEQGRWQAAEGDAGFEVLQQVAVAPVRASGQYLNSQQDVWEDVAGVRNTANRGAISVRMSEPMSVTFNTNTSLVDALEFEPDATSRMREKVRAHFAAQEKAPVGFAYAIDGKPVCIRVFAHSRLFAAQLDSFVATMCLEAALATGEKRASALDMTTFARGISDADEKVVATSAANANGYREGDSGWNASCYLGSGRDRVKLSEDWTAR